MTIGMWRWGLSITAVIVALLVAVLPWPHVQHGLLLVLLLVLPTLAWAGRLAGGVGSRLLLAFGWVLVVDTAVALALHALPGALPSGLILLCLVGVVVVPLLPVGPTAGGWQPPALPQGWLRRWWPWLALLALALLLRLPNLGYKELQGDEGIILTRAAAMLTGDDAEIYLHQKGPVEILLPLLTWGGTGQMSEFWGRLPFTLASAAAVVAVAYLARLWFGATVGWLAGLLFVVNGFAVAFARIIQYQSFVMMWGVLALAAATLYARHGRFQHIFLAGAFMAAGLLAHYDAILFGPALGWLLLSRVWRRRLPVREWATAIAAAVGLLAAFYAPFVLSPNFARTGSYLVNDRIGAGSGSALFNGSLTAVWRMVTFYNSTYYVVGLLLLALVGMVALRRRYPDRIQAVVGAVLLLAVPLLVYTLVVADPRTHVYTFFPGLVVPAAVGISALLERMPTVSGKRIAAGLVGVWWLVAGGYLLLMFVDTNPERQRTWADNRPAFYPVTWTEPPQFGLFGFPYQAGWRVVGQYAADLPLPYASNEEEEITNYYMAQAPRTHCTDNNTFMLAQDVQDVLPYAAEALAGLDPLTRVRVDGQEKMVLYGRSAGLSLPSTLDADGVVLWRTPDQVAPPQPQPQVGLDVVLGDVARLLGYDVSATAVVPGETVTVTLYWEALAPQAQNYQVFTHLYDGNMRGQHDGAPECGIMPTTRWEPGQIIVDPHPIHLDAGTPPGTVPLLVGMYNLVTLQRLQQAGSGEDAIYLTDLIVRAP